MFAESHSPGLSPEAIGAVSRAAADCAQVLTKIHALARPLDHITRSPEATVELRALARTLVRYSIRLMILIDESFS